MTEASDFEIFLVAIPGLEGPLCAEARAKGFKAKSVPGGVTLKGGWPEVWRANLEIRGASRVIARIGAFRAQHLAQLDKRARDFPWGEVLRRDVPFRVEASCKASRIYHSGAAAERIERAIAERLPSGAITAKRTPPSSTSARLMTCRPSASIPSSLVRRTFSISAIQHRDLSSAGVKIRPAVAHGSS